eukprot:gnl/TRDRNA2_/TRDRNA2_54481_c0_seq1.p1 gnl/TRDRNA2_/TRDRNA2_54481_c0~~gnl/TRDRNA2_/TRDRNA2_54481_c0_seq1.p1  ORF type:complete len:103 (+),score=1.99 gnl/TRDRNA2_/TRDRNA2_54481_c0_seq1:208-516(+)
MFETAGARMFLQNLLNNGLAPTSKAMEIALALSSDNHHHSRWKLHKVNGSQGQYQWLDSDGAARAPSQLPSPCEVVQSANLSRLRTCTGFAIATGRPCARTC